MRRTSTSVQSGCAASARKAWTVSDALAALLSSNQLTGCSPENSAAAHCLERSVAIARIGVVVQREDLRPPGFADQRVA